MALPVPLICMAAVVQVLITSLSSELAWLSSFSISLVSCYLHVPKTGTCMSTSPYTPLRTEHDWLINPLGHVIYTDTLAIIIM